MNFFFLRPVAAGLCLAAAASVCAQPYPAEKVPFDLLRGAGCEPLVMRVDEFSRFHRAEFTRWGDRVRAVGAKLEP